MKDLHSTLENGLIPLVEIAKLLFPNMDYDYVNFDKPEFYENKLLVSVVGDKYGNGVTEYLFFENMQFKILCLDCYWTSDNFNKTVKVVNRNQIPLLMKLVELGVMPKDEIFNT